MTTARFNFDENILKLSSTNDINKIGDEWVIIDKQTLPTQSGQCICQRKIKHIVYLYNAITKQCTLVGSKCLTKFGKRITRTGNPVLVDMFKQYNKDSSYELIDDIFAYSENIKQRLEEYIEKQYKNKINLDELLSNIKELIDDYGFVGLTELYNAINLTISLERMERYERERQEREQREREQRERGQRERGVKLVVTFEMLLKQKKQEQQEQQERERERIQQQLERERIKQVEQERNERIRELDCKRRCGIDPCLCENPEYKLMSINNNYYCNRCSKWKCRC